MKKYDYVSWHNHSEYSEFDGLAKLTDLVKRAKELNMKGIGLTDHGVVGGWIKFLKECTSESNGGPIAPIMGCEFYLSKNHLAKSKDEQPDGKAGNRHLCLYAKNFKGYQNICRMSQKSHLDGQYYGNPRIDLDILYKHREGVICSSACLSSIVNNNLLHDRYDQAKKVCSLFKDMFEDHFFLEVMYHGISAQKVIIPDIIKLSNELNIDIVATNDSHYIHKSNGKSHNVLMAMSMNKCIQDPKTIHFPYEEFYLKTAEEMNRVWKFLPNSMSNSLKHLEKIDYKDISRNLFGGMRLPIIDLPEKYKNISGSEFDKDFSYLKDLVKIGMKKRGHLKDQRYIKEVKKELDDIEIAWKNNGYNFARYFLICYDGVKFANENDVLVGPGRGSGFASFVLRYLDITYGPDPMNYDLYWERFLGFAEKRYILEQDIY